MFSRGLLISLGITTIYSLITYFYFNNRISNIEDKIDVMFNLIKSYSKENLNNENFDDNLFIYATTPRN